MTQTALANLILQAILDSGHMMTAGDIARLCHLDEIQITGGLGELMAAGLVEQLTHDTRRRGSSRDPHYITYFIPTMAAADRQRKAAR